MLLLAFKNKSFNVQLVRKLLAYHHMFKSFCHGINFGSHLWQINCLYLTFEVLVSKWRGKCNFASCRMWQIYL